MKEDSQPSFQTLNDHLAWKALSSLPFYLSCMLILLSFSTNRGICQRIDVGELSHPAMHKRLFRLGNAVDDDTKQVFVGGN